MFQITIISNSIALTELKRMADNQFGSLIKAVVDIEKNVMAIGGEMHADEEAYMIDEGSKQENLLGINIHPEKEMPEQIEFDLMINIPHILVIVPGVLKIRKLRNE
jgi:hypothetical protein